MGSWHKSEKARYYGAFYTALTMGLYENPAEKIVYCGTH